MAYRFSFGDTAVSLLEQALNRQERERRASEEQKRFDAQLALQKHDQILREEANDLAAIQAQRGYEVDKAKLNISEKEFELNKRADERSDAAHRFTMDLNKRMNDPTIRIKGLPKEIQKYVPSDAGVNGKISYVEFQKYFENYLFV